MEPVQEWGSAPTPAQLLGAGGPAGHHLYPRGSAAGVGRCEAERHGLQGPAGQYWLGALDSGAGSKRPANPEQSERWSWRLGPTGRQTLRHRTWAVHFGGPGEAIHLATLLPDGWRSEGAHPHRMAVDRNRQTNRRGATLQHGLRHRLLRDQSMILLGRVDGQRSALAVFLILNAKKFYLCYHIFMKQISHSLIETENIAKEFLNNLQPQTDKATVVFLQGDLGSGKTSFTQAVGKILNADSNITSPTFVIEKIYKITHPIFTEMIHIDAYRLSSGEELKVLNWEEIIKDPQKIIFLEWPEMIPDLVKGGEKVIKFKFLNEEEREIEY